MPATENKMAITNFKRVSHLALFFCLFTASAFAYSGTSPSYQLISGAPSEGGASRIGASLKLTQDSIGEACAGRSQSANYILNSGFIATIQANPPVQSPPIPDQTWCQKTSRKDVLDLSEYFTSPDNKTLSYTVSGNDKIQVAIDPDTHKVSLSQPKGWYGIEKVKFTATDPDLESAESNEVALTVEQIAPGDSPPANGGVALSNNTPYATQRVFVTADFSDPDGAADIKDTYLLTNANFDPKNCLYARYDAEENKLYLRDETDTAWLGGFAPGSANNIDNKYARLECAQSAVTNKGTNTISVKFSLVFKNTFTGVKDIYLKVVDKQAGYDQWTQKQDICVFRKPVSPP
jgi:hypothetical protein